MIRYAVHLVIFFSLVTLFQLISKTVVLAAPGDFLLQWGAQQHFQDPQAIARDQSGNIYVTDFGTNSGVQVFNSAGKRLRKWGSYGSGDGQFAYPLGITVDQNSNVYVSELINNRVQVFDSAGNFLRKWGSFGTGDGQFDSPFGIAVDGNGNVYVADANNSRIQVFDSVGNFLRKWGSFGTGDGQLNYPAGIAIDDIGNVYVADSCNNRVQVFDSGGNFLRKWGSYGEADGQFAAPNTITVGKNEQVFVVDTNNSRVQIFDSTGTFLGKWGSFGEENEQFKGPLGIVGGTNGNIYVVDSNNDSVKIFDGTGAFQRKWWSYGAGDGEFNGPNETAIDASGNVYVVDTNNHRVEVFTSTGTFLRKWGGYGVGDGQFQYPEGIALDGSGNVYVADKWNNRIEVFDNSGNFLRKWGDSGAEHLYVPSGVAIDGNGNVYVADTGNRRVEVFDNTGNFLRQWGGQGDEHLGVPYRIALDSNSNVYVTDSGDNRVEVYDSEGNFLRQMGEGQSHFPRGIAVDAGGNVFVAYPENDAILVFDSKGALLSKWGSYGDVNGLFNDPWGVAVDKSSNKVYVADTKNNRVQVFAGYDKPFLPTPWETQDIGTVGLAGSTGYQSGIFTVKASGADIWGTSDGFRYVYQSLTGDGQVIVWVASQQSANSWAKAGVMIRETLAANSKNALMALTPGNGANFQRRLTSGGYSVNTAGPVIRAPYWVRMVRSGNTFSGYVSTNGVNWTLVESDTIAMGSTVYVGIAVTNHGNSALSTATLAGLSVTAGTPIIPPTVNITAPANGVSFAVPASIAISATAFAGTGATVSRVDFYAGTTLVGSATTSPYSFTWRSVPAGSYSLTARVTDSLNRTVTSSPVGITVAAGALPTPWATRDIGSVGIGGSASYLNGTFTLNGSGTDIWGKADAFRYVYHSLTGDGQIIARVASLQNTNSWAKGGVMIRETLTANSRQALMALTPDNVAAFQRRLVSGGLSVSTAGPRVTAPYWVRLVRSGNTFSGYISSNGVNWVLVGSDTISMSSSVYVGLAVTSHNNAALCAVTIDGVK